MDVTDDVNSLDFAGDKNVCAGWGVGGVIVWFYGFERTWREKRMGGSLFVLQPCKAGWELSQQAVDLMLRRQQLVQKS